MTIPREEIMKSALIIILTFFCCFESNAATISAETGKLLKANNEAFNSCAAEVAKTGSEGAACQKYKETAQAYQEAYRRNECPKNKTAKRCTMSDSEVQATAEQRLKNKVEEMKKEQEAAIQKTKQAEQQTPQPSAADKSPVQAVGIIAAPSNAQTPSPSQTTASGSSRTLPSSAKHSTTAGGSPGSAPAAASGLFGTLTAKGAEIFIGLREIIFAVAGFGITAVAIGGFFGAINWKWLSAIIIGLVVISTTSAIINYMVDSDVTSGMITDTLIHAN